MKLLLLMMAWLLPASLYAQERTLPSDADLRTAYCITVVGTGLETITAVAKSGLMPDGALNQMTEAQRTTLDRLKSYLFPRVGMLEPAGLLAAKQRAQHDLATIPITNGRCSASCGPTTSADTKEKNDKWWACVSSCSREDEAFKRMATCNAVNWLPF